MEAGMALTVAYSLTQQLQRIYPAADPAENSDTVALAGGGFATVADVPGGFSVPVVYDAAGNQQPQVVNSFAPDARIAQLTDGTIALVGTHSGGGIDFVRFTSQGVVGIPSALLPFASDSNPDIAAIAEGNGLGFVVASQRVMDGADHNINIYLYANGGPLQFTVDASAANDQNASVAGLADGGFAVAWERIDAGGNSRMWYAVYNHDTSVRQAPTPFFPIGTINHQVNVTALQSGGFAIGFESNGFSGGQTDIVVASFNSAGQNTKTGFASTLATDDSEAAVTTLSNGMVLSTFTNHFGGERDDYDILGAVFDPATGVVTDPGDPLKIDFSGDTNTQSSVSAFGLAQFVVSYSGGVTGDVTQRTYQLVRTVTGDASDDSFTGDDAVDILNGLGGSDSLAGGANDDTINGGDGNDLLNGGSGKDALNGGANIDFLLGGDGDDRLDGGTGADALIGGLGNDTYIVDVTGDEVSETSGPSSGVTDRVMARVSYALGAGVEIELLTTVSSSAVTAINLTGNALHQDIAGNAGANILSDGGSGVADTMRGFGGNDTYRVYNSGDLILETSSSDNADRVIAAVDYRLGAGVRVEIMSTNGSAGTSGIDLTGNEFAQSITGNAGDNRLEGREGADTLRGLGGDDTFVFNTKFGAGNVDTITDFNIADDRFLLSDAVFTALSTGTLSAAAFRVNTTGLAGDASDRIIYETDTGKVFYDADGTGAAAGVHFATISIALSLTNADFSVA
jgi:Ca2+-binding RTX toxin-like protein